MIAHVLAKHHQSPKNHTTDICTPPSSFHLLPPLQPGPLCLHPRPLADFLLVQHADVDTNDCSLLPQRLSPAAIPTLDIYTRNSTNGSTLQQLAVSAHHFDGASQ